MELSNFPNVQRDINFNKELRHLTLLRHRHHSNCSSSAVMCFRRSATTLYMLNYLSAVIKILTTRRHSSPR